MIQEVIRANIESKLNNNTANLVFSVGIYVELDDQEDNYKDFIYNVRNGFKNIATDYVPVMIDFTADYEPIPNQINFSAQANLTFLVHSEPLQQAEFESKIDIINELVAKIVGNSEDVVDGTKTYHTVWNMDAIRPAGITRPLNGKYYTQFQVSIYIDASDTNYYGNRYRYYLNGSLLYPFDGDVNRENEENYPHIQGDYEAKGGNKTSQWSANLVGYVDATLEAILDKRSSATYDMEEVYTYAEYKNGVKTHEFPVKITSISTPILLGERQKISISLIKSDQAAS